MGDGSVTHKQRPAELTLSQCCAHRRLALLAAERSLFSVLCLKAALTRCHTPLFISFGNYGNAIEAHLPHTKEGKHFSEAEK